MISKKKKKVCTEKRKENGKGGKEEQKGQSDPHVEETAKGSYVHEDNHIQLKMKHTTIKTITKYTKKEKSKTPTMIMMQIHYK